MTLCVRHFAFPSFCRAVRCIHFALTTWLVFSAVSLFAENEGNVFWQQQSIYQIITDRFFDGDSSNNNADGNFEPSGRTSVHGGDFKGIEEKLDYIQALGATAIWISPVVLNDRGAFHGYAGMDFYKVDPHWGTMADLKHLVEAAHARGILVIDDIVVNHGGNLVISGDHGYPNFKSDGYTLKFRDPLKQYPPPFDLNATNPSLTNLFHDHGLIQNYNDSTQVELGELSGLDDFRTESPYVREQMKKVYEYWIEQVGFDGFRIDTVKHVEMSFWQEWCPAVRAFAAHHGKTNFFMFGEALDGSDAKCGSYTGNMGGGPFKLDSVLDYTLYFKINSLFASASASTKSIADHYGALAANYDPAAQNQLVTFLDNHDQARFLSQKSATIDRLKVAVVFLYTARGIPCLYYGTEQAFNGAKDPWDREDMFAGQFEWGPSRGDNFNMTHPLFQWVAKLNNLRRLYPALGTGEQSILWSDANGPGLLAFTRRLGAQEVLVVFNTAQTNQTLPSCPINFPSGTKMENVLEQMDSFTVDSGHTPSLLISATSAKIFVAEPQVRPLDPVVTRISPAHDAKEISLRTEVVLDFSKPMDTTSVERAFATAPSVKGTFSWNTKRDEMTFTPEKPGFPAQSTVSVELGETARDAISRRTFHAAFESRFSSGISNVCTKEQFRTDANHGNENDNPPPKTKPVGF
jgi:glycosidase